MKKRYLLVIFILLVFFISGCEDVKFSMKIPIKKVSISKNIDHGFLENRKTELLDLIETDPSEALKFPELPQREISKLSLEEKEKYVEKRGTFEGYLEVVAVDDFENPENSRYVYYLNTDSNKYELFSDHELPALSSVRVSINGLALSDKLAVNQLEINDDSYLRRLADFNNGKNKILVLIGEYGDLPFGYNLDIIQNEVFGDNKSLNQFFIENSDNKSWFEGDIIGPLYLGENHPPLTTIDGAFASVPLMAENMILIADPLVNFTEYKRIMFIFGYPGFDGYGIALAGVGFQEEYLPDGIVNVSKSYYIISALNISKTIYTLFSHELGHNFGALHSHFLNCGPNFFWKNVSNCSLIEYGNLYTIMGSPISGGHFTANYKRLFGWFNRSEYTTVSKPQIYEISPLESKYGVKEVIIPFRNNSTFSIEYPGNENFSYSLEYRTQCNYVVEKDLYCRLYDYSGIFVNVARVYKAYPWNGYDDVLIDSSPSMNYNYIQQEDASLNEGDYYFDPVEKIFIKVISLSNNSAKVYIDPDWKNNSIRNPSFEIDLGADYFYDWDKDDNIANNQIPDGWYSNSYSSNINVSIDNIVKMNGKYSARIDVNNNKAFLVQQFPVEYGKKYKISGYIKTNLTKGYALISSHPFDANRNMLTGGSLDNYNSDRLLYGINDWTYQEFTVTADRKDAKYLQIECYVSPSPNSTVRATGLVWCDDLNIEEIGTAECSDGTVYGQCSSQKPLYCDSGNLVNSCQKCGCSAPEGICQPDGTCKKQIGEPKIKRTSAKFSPKSLWQRIVDILF
jgi:hypothetical protein